MVLENNLKFTDSVSMLTWAYNEEDSIIDFLEKATHLMNANVVNYEIILIDDCSTDNTFNLAQEFQLKNPNLKIFRNQKNMNVGFSSQKAIKKASKKYLFWQTTDWGYDISDLKTYLEYLSQFDIVQGVRRGPVQVKLKFFWPFVIILKLFGIKHLTRRSDTVYKAVISLINFLVIRTLFRVKLSDFQNVTFYRTEWIQSIQFESNSAFSNPEAIIKSHWAGQSIKEVPINFIPRIVGEPKGTKLKAIISAMNDICRLYWLWMVLQKRDKKKGNIDRLPHIKWTWDFEWIK